MVQRHHIPVVVTTSDELDKAETIEYVERVLSQLEQAEGVHRTYVEGTGIEEGEAERLLDVLSRVDDSDISSAIDAIDTIVESEENT